MNLQKTTCFSIMAALALAACGDTSTSPKESNSSSSVDLLLSSQMLAISSSNEVLMESSSSMEVIGLSSSLDSSPTGTNLFSNGDFATGTTAGWVIEQQGTATETHEVIIGGGPNGKNALKITVLTTGASVYGYEVQVNYPFALEVGKTYTYSVWAKTEPAGYEIANVLSQNHAPWGHHTEGADTYPELTGEWAEYGFTWTSTETDPLMRISLGNLAKVANQVFYFADAKLIVE